MRHPRFFLGSAVWRPGKGRRNRPKWMTPLSGTNAGISCFDADRNCAPQLEAHSGLQAKDSEINLRLQHTEIVAVGTRSVRDSRLIQEVTYFSNLQEWPIKTMPELLNPASRCIYPASHKRCSLIFNRWPPIMGDRRQPESGGSPC